MKGSRVVRTTWCYCGLSAALFSCTQIAGLDGDYRLDTSAEQSGGEGGANHGGTGPNDPSSGTSPGAGSDSLGGRGGGSAAGGSAAGGSATAAGTSSAVGGESNAAGEGNLGGESNAGGSSGVGFEGPVRIGYSEFHDSDSGYDNASGHLANATFALPAGTRAGDFLLVFFGADHSLRNLSGTTLAEMGWTLIDQKADYGTDGQGTYLLYKFASASEPDPIIFADINDAPSGNGVQGLLSVYRGVNATAPINAYERVLVPSGESDVTTVSTPTPAVTTNVNDCLLIAGFSPDSAVDLPVITAWPAGFVRNQVSVVNKPYPYPLAWANIYAAERRVSRAQTVPPSSFIWSPSEAHAYGGALTFVLALAP